MKKVDLGHSETSLAEMCPIEEAQVGVFGTDAGDYIITIPKDGVYDVSVGPRSFRRAYKAGEKIYVRREKA